MVTRLRSGSQICTKSMPYARSLYNFHHIKSCHPPVKQYITMHHDTRNTRVAMARAALCVVLCAHGCILYTGQCPPQGTSLEVSLPPSLPSPTLLHLACPSLRCSLLPPLASSLPSFLRSGHACVPSSLVPFLNLPSLPPLQLPPSLTSSLSHAISLLLPPHSPLAPSLPPSLPRSLAPSLPPSLPPSIPPSLPPTIPPSLPSSILHPASLLPCLPPWLSACLRRIIQCTPCVVSGQQLHWV